MKPRLSEFAYAFFNTGNILPWYHAANNLIIKDEGFLASHWERFDFQPNIAKLSMTPLCRLWRPFAELFCDCFPVRDTLVTHLQINTVFTFDTLNHNLDM